MKNSIYIFLIFIWSCGNYESDQNILPVVELSFENIALIDTFKNELKYDTASYITASEFLPMYIGAIKDSIILNYNTRKIKTIDTWVVEKWPEVSYDSLKINIHIDTSQIIGSADFFPLQNLKKEKDWTSNHRGNTKSHPVLIKNNSDDTLSIGFGDYIPMIIEAVDSLGEWEQIQEPYFYFCGTGIFPIYLNSNEILITSCKLYEGNYKTKMRLRHGLNKSNEFYGKMNYSQFNTE